MSETPHGVLLETPPSYVPIAELSRLTGLPQTFIKRLTDDGKLPYLEPLVHKRFYCLRDVEVALSKIAHATMAPAPVAMPIDLGDFGVRAAKVLRLLGIKTWEQLAALPKAELAAAPGIGKGTLC